MEKIELTLGLCYKLVMSNGEIIIFKFLGMNTNGAVICQRKDRSTFDFNTVGLYSSIEEIDCDNDFDEVS